MNFRLRSTQPSYHINPEGQFLVPNPQAEHPVAKDDDAPIQPTPTPQPLAPAEETTAIGGKLLKSSGSFEQIFPVLFHHVPPHKGADGSIILHVGACRGVESVKLYRAYFRTLVALEPDARNLQQLRRALHDEEQQHGFRTLVWPFAASDYDGRATLRLSNIKGAEKPFTESNTIKKVKLHHQQSPEMDWNEEQEVGCCRLDTMWRNMGEPIVHLLFSDVEGAEKEMLTGARKMLGRTRAVFTEFSHAERYEGALNLQDTCALLPKSFECVAVWNHGFFGDALFLNREPLDGHS